MVPCKMMSATFETSFQTVTPITSLSAWRHARTQQIGSRLWPHRCLSAEIIHDWGRWLRSRPRRHGNGVCRIWILLLRCEWMNGCKWVRERVCTHVCVCKCVCVHACAWVHACICVCVHADLFLICMSAFVQLHRVCAYNMHDLFHYFY